MVSSCLPTRSTLGDIHNPKKSTSLSYLGPISNNIVNSLVNEGGVTFGVETTRDEDTGLFRKVCRLGIKERVILSLLSLRLPLPRGKKWLVRTFFQTTM